MALVCRLVFHDFSCCTGMTDRRPSAGLVRIIRRWGRGDPPADAGERREDLLTIKWMQLISSTSMIIALVLWMVWFEGR